MKRGAMIWAYGTAGIIALCLITSVTWGPPSGVKYPEEYRGSTSVKTLDFDLAFNADVEE